MTFWTDSKLDPVRKYRFEVAGSKNFGDGEAFWWARSVDKPTVSVNVGEYQLINHKFKFPGVPTWQDITLVLVDVGKKAAQTLQFLADSGYAYPNVKSSSKTGGIRKDMSNQFVITQFSGKGAPIETWTLYNAWINSINFGSLSYSDDDLVEIELSITYDWAKLE